MTKAFSVFGLFSVLLLNSCSFVPASSMQSHYPVLDGVELRGNISPQFAATAAEYVAAIMGPGEALNSILSGSINRATVYTRVASGSYVVRILELADGTWSLVETWGMDG